MDFMDGFSESLLHAVVVGIGATLVMDVWTLAQQRLFGVKTLDYALVGRWIGHFRHGRFRHASIAKAAPVRGERAVGWAAHYLIGIAFAGVLLAGWGSGWVRMPSLGPALAVGVGTVVAPFFILQPAFGLGVAASRTPRPAVARLRSLSTHLVFGVGLYLGGHVAGLLW
jgi:hypothetical protein